MAFDVNILIGMRPLWAVLPALLLAGGPVRGPTSLCGVALPSTAGWPVLTSRNGTFRLRLPPGAREVAAACVDTDCGRVDVGRWSIRYDGGATAGAGDRAAAAPGDAAVRRCPLRAAGRRGEVLLARWAADPRPAPARRLPPESSWAGHYVARAALPRVAGGAGLYLATHSARAEDRAAFLAAVSTLEALTPPGRRDAPRR